MYSHKPGPSAPRPQALPAQAVNRWTYRKNKDKARGNAKGKARGKAKAIVGSKDPTSIPSSSHLLSSVQGVCALLRGAMPCHDHREVSIESNNAAKASHCGSPPSIVTNFAPRRRQNKAHHLLNERVCCIPGAV